ncbi:Proactivator polypeptide [Trichinella nativa]|uniref:Proactivator polypeptide n=1 Tax=Trichinella nativa TaxID=6335 RepID=A0A0V1KPC8_9BILA|nr:Proactivator polypeptide [Trichinella nativa]
MAASKISSIDQCFVCDAVKNIAQTCQKNQEPKMIIEEKIQSFCQQSKPGSKACISNANKYLPFVLDAIIKDGSDLKTCNIITNKTCDNISKMGESENGALACLTCFVGTNLFSRYLLMHEQEIKELMMPICNASILGKNEKEICFDLFDQHFDYTFGAIVTTLSTKVFCGAIIGCPLLKKHEREEITSVFEDVECSACMISFKYLKQFLDNAHAEKYLIKALGTIYKITTYLINGRKSPVQHINLNYKMQSCTILMIASIIATASSSRFKPSTVSMDDRCFFCEASKAAVNSLYENRFSTQEIRKSMENFCRAMSPLSYSCMSHSSKYLPFLIDAVNSGENEDPDMCSNIIGTECSNTFQEPTKNGIECIACKLWVNTILSRAIKMEETLKEYGMIACNSTLLSEEKSEECGDFIKNYFHSLYESFIKMIDSQFICYEATLCSKKNYHSTSFPTPLNNDSECTLCQTVLNYMEKILTENQFEMLYLKFWEKLCSGLPKEVQTKCSSFVKEFVEPRLHEMLQFLTAEQFCPQPGFANFPANVVTTAVMQTSLAIVVFATVVLTAAQRQPTVKEQCYYCRLVKKLASQMDGSDESMRKAEAELISRCDALPRYRYSCAVNTNAFLRIFTSPESNGEIPETCENILGKDCRIAFQEPDNSLDCTICKLWARMVEKEIFNKEDKFHSYFERACKSESLSKRQAQICTQLIGNHFSILFKETLKMTLGEYICKTTDHCADVKNLAPSGTNDFAELECAICHTVFDFLAQKMESMDLKKKLLDFGLRLCEKLPPNAKVQCKEFFNGDLKKLLEDLIFFLSEDNFCPIFELCPKSNLNSFKKQETIMASETNISKMDTQETFEEAHKRRPKHGRP